jgi:hypothetical protein
MFKHWLILNATHLQALSVLALTIVLNKSKVMEHFQVFILCPNLSLELWYSVWHFGFYNKWQLQILNLEEVKSIPLNLISYNFKSHILVFQLHQ